MFVVSCFDVGLGPKDSWLCACSISFKSLFFFTKLSCSVARDLVDCVVDVEGLVCVRSRGVGVEGGDVTCPLVPVTVVVVGHHRHEVRIFRQGGDVVGPVNQKRCMLNDAL